MARIAGLVQLKTGDAISGIVSRRSPFFRFLRVENAELLDAATQSTTKADGVIFVPKANALFIQQLVRVVADRPMPVEPARLPGPTLTSRAQQPSAQGTPESAVR